MREARSRIQSQIYRNSGGEEPIACPTSSSDRPGTAVTVADLSFEGDLRIPSVDRERIAVSIKQRSYSGSKDDIASEVAERVQRAWQNSGYFAAQAYAETGR